MKTYELYSNEDFETFDLSKSFADLNREPSLVALFQNSEAIELFSFDSLISSLPSYLTEPLRLFFENKKITNITKSRLRKYMLSLGDRDLINLALSATRIEASSRLSLLWKESSVSNIQDNVWADIFRHSKKHSTLAFSNDVMTLSATQIKNSSISSGLIINANPLFSSILTEDSFAKAIAHEEFHHKDNHYKIMCDILLDWLKENPEASPEEKMRTRALAERSIDCITNEKLGVNSLGLILNEKKPSFGRLLYCAAIAAGESILEKDGSFVIELQTFESTDSKFNVTTDRTSSVRNIFKMLTKADSCNN